jgi:flagellar hook protein FlgE
MTVRSLAAADSGIQTMQTMLDVIGNNVANVNTDGYKETSAEFSDLLNQQLTPAGAPVPGLASTNPSAIGSGAEVSGIATNFTEGAITQTGVETDAAISGSGFFVVDRAGQQYFTRAGNFHLDANGVLATSDGGEVQGWMAGQPITGATTAITIPQGEVMAPQQTANVTLGGNLDANATQPVVLTSTIYDAAGNAVPLTLTLTPPTSGGTAGQWTLAASVTENGTTTKLTPSSTTVSFNSSGQITAPVGTPSTQPGEIQLTGLPADFTAGTAGGTASINLVFPPPTSAQALTQYGGNQTAEITSQDGNPTGTLESFSISQTGAITGTFSNGLTQQLATIALASFTNDGGLTSLGTLDYQPSASSGQPQIGAPGTGARGTLIGGALEQSNVNLASQLTDLVTAQTAYQADTKVVASTATVLQALVSMP